MQLWAPILFSRSAIPIPILSFLPDPGLPINDPDPAHHWLLLIYVLIYIKYINFNEEDEEE